MNKIDPTPDLPQETPLHLIRLPTRIRNVFKAAGIFTVGEARETSDAAFLSFVNFGPGSLFYIRKALGPAR